MGIALYGYAVCFFSASSVLLQRLIILEHFGFLPRKDCHFLQGYFYQSSYESVFFSAGSTNPGIFHDLSLGVDFHLHNSIRICLSMKSFQFVSTFLYSDQTTWEDTTVLYTGKTNRKNSFLFICFSRI